MTPLNTNSIYLTIHMLLIGCLNFLEYNAILCDKIGSSSMLTFDRREMLYEYIVINRANGRRAYSGIRY